MDEDIKKLLAKARKMKKEIENGSFPVEEVLEENICFGMYDNLHSIRSEITKDSKTKPQKKDKK